MEDNNLIFKQLLHEQKYSECIKIIKDKIINYLVCLINEKNTNYEYTNIIDLIMMSEHYIDDERKNIARNLEYFSIEEEEIITLYRLLDICELYDIK